MKLVFLHLPKTGGVSIRNECVRYFGQESSVTLYGRDSRTTSAIARELYFPTDHKTLDDEERETRLIKYIKENDIDFFSTHDFDNFLKYFEPSVMITFIRDPIDRVISHYNFFNLIEKKISGSFEEFVHDERYHNFQSKLLRNVDISKLGMVGITERFDESISRLNASFGLSLKPRHRNRTPWRLRKVRRANLNEEFLAEIRAFNAEDAALYEEAEKRLIAAGF